MLEGVGLELFVLNGVLEMENLEFSVPYGQIERVDLELLLLDGMLKTMELKL